MRKIYLVFLCLPMTLSIPNFANAQCGVNILSTPGFDAPLQPSIGNNLTGLFSFGGWTITGAAFNIIRTNGSAYAGGPNNAQDGTQYVDVTNAAGTVYQDFTISGATVPVAYGGYFSSREAGGYTNWTASIQIYALPSNTLVSTSNTRNFTTVDGNVPAQENWYFLLGNVTLAPGNYRYVANLGNYGNFDAAFVNTSCVLPVVLNQFAGSYTNQQVKLNWKVESQVGLSAFEVEKSTDGRNFATIASIAPSNTAAYNFNDDKILKGSTYYYRLKMKDKDGSITYSAICLIKTSQEIGLAVTPNPVKDFMNISGLKSVGTITLRDASGKQMREAKIQSQVLSLNVATLKSGTYFLQYWDGNQKFTKQIIKL